MSGVLAVWNDHAGDAAAYEAWYQEEHIPQRLGFAGFRQARRYAAVEADRAYFTWYALDGVACLHAPEYLACLAAPTPRTRAIMPEFRGMVRAGMDVVSAMGRGLGGYAVCARAALPCDLPAPVLAAGVVRVQAWRAAGRQAASPEMRFRGAADGTAHDVLLVECLRLDDARRVAVALRGAVPAERVAVGLYGLMWCVEG